MDLVVPLGTVVRQHGIPKGEISKWKIDLFVPGGENFQKLRSLYFFLAPSDGRLHARSSAELGARKIDLKDDCEALGAKWGQTPSVLVSLISPNFDPLKMTVGIRRGDFLNPSDFYICDLLGREFFDSQDSKAGTYLVEGVFNASQATGIESWIIRLISVTRKKVFEIPLQPLLDRPEVFSQIRREDFSRPIDVGGLAEWAGAFVENGDVPDDV
jgi:hypothetical protein